MESEPQNNTRYNIIPYHQSRLPSIFSVNVEVVPSRFVHQPTSMTSLPWPPLLQSALVFCQTDPGEWGLIHLPGGDLQDYGFRTSYGVHSRYFRKKSITTNETHHALPRGSSGRIIHSRESSYLQTACTSAHPPIRPSTYPSVQLPTKPLTVISPASIPSSAQ